MTEACVILAIKFNISAFNMIFFKISFENCLKHTHCMISRSVDEMTIQLYSRCRQSFEKLQFLSDLGVGLSIFKEIKDLLHAETVSRNEYTQRILTKFGHFMSFPNPRKNNVVMIQ